MRSIVMGALALVGVGLNGLSALAADGRFGVELVERCGRVVIVDVIKGSGAEGVFRAGDVLYKVGATRIGTVQDALNAKADAPNNKDVPIVIERDGSLYDLNGRFEKGQPYGKYS